MDNNLISPASLLSLINYQNGAVVSRELISKAAGTITLFAFDKDQGLSEHSAPYDAFLEALEGEAEVTIDGNSKTLKKGEIVVFPAGHPHALKALTPFKMLLTMVRS